MNQNTLKQLITELVRPDDMLVVIDSGGAVAEMYTRNMEEPDFKGQWAMIEGDVWHVHLNLTTVDGVQFVENADHGHESMPRVYYVRFSGKDSVTLIRFYFPNPWLDEDEKPAEFQPEKLRFFEEFRDRYAGRDGIVFVQLPGEVLDEEELSEEMIRELQESRAEAARGELISWEEVKRELANE